MTYEEYQKIETWKDELEEGTIKSLQFVPEDEEIKARQVAAILFLYSKLKPSEKNRSWLFGTSYDCLFIAKFDAYEPFTKEDFIRMDQLGIGTQEDSFYIYTG